MEFLKQLEIVQHIISFAPTLPVLVLFFPLVTASPR